jgi:hypothetical protein
MMVIDDDRCDYDDNVHHGITDIVFLRRDIGNFFKGNRFPNLISVSFSILHPTEIDLECSSLENLSIYSENLIKLKMICPSLKKITCFGGTMTEFNLEHLSLETIIIRQSQITDMYLNCPSLTSMHCTSSQLAKLELFCPRLQELVCFGNPLNNLNGIEFCSELKILVCSSSLIESVKILQSHIPDIRVSYVD